MQVFWPSSLPQVFDIIFIRNVQVETRMLILIYLDNATGFYRVFSLVSNLFLFFGLSWWSLPDFSLVYGAGYGSLLKSPARTLIL